MCARVILAKVLFSVRRAYIPAATCPNNVTTKHAVIVATLIAIHVPIVGFVYVNAARSKVFNADFFRDAKKSGLTDEHKAATGSDQLARGGYPDMGNGRYAALLPYGT